MRLEDLGAVTLTLPGAELFAALQTGVVDAVLLPKDLLLAIGPSNFASLDVDSFVVSDGFFDSTAGLALTSSDLPGPNRDPNAIIDFVETEAGQSVTLDPLDNDRDEDGDALSLMSVSAPANGVVTDNGDGTLTYAPNAGFTGNESFDYTVTDGNGGTDNATVTVTVRAETSASDVRIDGTVLGTDAAPLAETIVRFVVDGADVAQTVTDAGGGFTLQIAENTAGALAFTRSVTAVDIADIGVGDALDALRLAVGLAPSWGPADGADFVAADFDGNGAVTVADALDILRTAVGLDTGDSQPRWVFGDPLTGSADADTVPSLDNQIDIAALTADAQAILVGNMEDYV